MMIPLSIPSPLPHPQVGLMQLTVNHVLALVPSDPSVTRYIAPGEINRDRVILNWVHMGADAAKSVKPGMAVRRVNGCAVRTLADYRAVFLPGRGCGKTKTAASAESEAAENDAGASSVAAAEHIVESLGGGEDDKSAGVRGERRESRSHVAREVSAAADTASAAELLLSGRGVDEEDRRRGVNMLRLSGVSFSDGDEEPASYEVDHDEPVDDVFSLETEEGAFFALPFRKTIQTTLASAAGGQGFVSKAVRDAAVTLGLVRNETTAQQAQEVVGGSAGKKEAEEPPTPAQEILRQAEEEVPTPVDVAGAPSGVALFHERASVRAGPLLMEMSQGKVRLKARHAMMASPVEDI